MGTGCLPAEERADRDPVSADGYLKSRGQRDGAGLCLVVPSSRTRGSGRNWNTESSI